MYVYDFHGDKSGHKTYGTLSMTKNQEPDETEVNLQV